jgi:NAD(P)-dependent dehydrogenase (short-subunit alcohol dehydrogenase family)
LAAAESIPGCIGIPGDVTNPETARTIVDKTVAAFGSIDIVVCNVGSGKSVSPGSENLPEWKRMFELNLWSTTNIVEAARAELSKTRGTIICISSICGKEVIANAPITYSVAKAALNAYVRGISKPLGKQGIRINAIALGNILFDGSVWASKLAENRTAVDELLDREVPLGHLGTPQDAANLVAFLSSDRAQFSTGSIWTLDGGQTRA